MSSSSNSSSDSDDTQYTEETSTIDGFESFDSLSSEEEGAVGDKTVEKPITLDALEIMVAQIDQLFACLGDGVNFNRKLKIAEVTFQHVRNLIVRDAKKLAQLQKKHQEAVALIRGLCHVDDDVPDDELFEIAAARVEEESKNLSPKQGRG